MSERSGGRRDPATPQSTGRPVVGYFEFDASVERDILVEGDDNKPSGWRLFAFILVFILFPIIFRPWWMAVISIVAFALFMKLVFPDIFNSM